MGNMPKHNFKISKPISDGSLQFDIDVFSSAIIPSLKNEAYATPNTSSQFTHTIKSIRHSSTLDTFYQQAFGQLDSLDMSLSAYTKAVDEIQGGGHLLASSEILNTQKRMLNEFSILPMNNALTPITSITTGLTTALNAGSKMTLINNMDNANIKGLLNIGYLNTKNGLLNLNSGYLGGALGADIAFGGFSLFGAINLAFAQNTYSGKIMDNALNGNYTDILLHTQAGMRYNIALSNTISFSPLTYLSLSHLYTKAFNEKSLVFAKSFGDNGQNILGGNIGAVFALRLPNKFSLDIYSVYEHILNTKQISANAQFLDFANSHFAIYKPLSKYALRSGLSLSTDAASHSKLSVGIFHEITKNTNSIGTQVQFVWKFGEAKGRENSNQ